MIPLPISLSDASGVPYYRQIEDQLAQFIHSGRLAPDSRLPSVRELAAHLLVSLITVRRSYADLETAGLIVRRQGYGTFVAPKIETVSRKKAVAEARALIGEALSHAMRLGLDRAAIEKVTKDLLSSKGHKDGYK